MNSGRSILRCIILVGMAVLLILPEAGSNRNVLASPASARMPILLAVTPTISPATGPAGSKIVLSAPAHSFPAGAEVVANFQDSSKNYAGILIGRGAISQDGSLNFPLRLPDEATAGPALVFITVNGSSSSTTFMVQPSIELSAVTVPSGGAVVVTGSGFSGVGAVTFSINGQDADVLTRDVVEVDAFGSFSGFVSIPGNLQIGTATLSATDGIYTATTQIGIGPTLGPASTAPVLGSSVAAGPTPTPVISGPLGSGSNSSAVPPAPVGTTSAYFAEGFTGQAATNGKATYTESLDFLNANPVEATISITYVVQGATAPVVLQRSIPAESVLRESVNDDVGPDKQVSAVITSPQQVFVGRVIARVSASGKRLDSSATQPVAAPVRQRLFPEGYTGATFQEYLTVLNPGAGAATVRVTLVPQGAAPAHPKTVTVKVPALSRSTVNVTGLNARSTAKSVGLIVNSNQPIVAERVLYFGSGSGSGKFGSTVSSGMGSPAGVMGVVAAGGAAQNFVTMLNPASSGKPVAVTASVADATGQPVGTPKTLHIAAGTRQTFSAPQASGATGGPTSILLNASGPIAAEAAQYFGGSPNVGSHPGVAYLAQGAAAHTVYLADVSTTLADETPITRTVYLYNPSTTPITVNAFYLGTSGSSSALTYTVPPSGITTVDVNGDAGLPAGPLGAIFTVNTSSGSLLASSLGLTADGRSATESAGIPGS